MRKLAFILISLFLALMASILFFQWKGYTSSKERTIIPPAQQTVDIRHANQNFYIRQTIDKLEAGVYPICFPRQAADIVCRNEDGQDCQWQGKGKTSLQLKVPQKVELSYKLPAPARTKSYLLGEWTAAIDTAAIAKTRVQMAEEVWRVGAWYAAAEPKGKKEMDFVDYYVYETDGTAPALYWQRKMLHKQASKGPVTIYAEEGKMQQPSALTALSRLEATAPVYAIVTEEYPPGQSGSLYILRNSSELGRVESGAVRREIKNRYQFAAGENWQADIISSALLGRPSGEEKARIMYKEMSRVLEPEQMDRWVSAILQKEGEKLASSDLDALIEEAAGFRTRFFQQNASLGKPVSKMTFADSRDVYIRGEKRPDLYMLYEQDHYLLPFADTLKALGYTVREIPEEKAIFVEKDGNRYRFYTKKNIFILNEEDYGLLTNPLTEMDGQIYIQAAWLKQLFHIPIVQSDNQIRIG